MTEERKYLASFLENTTDIANQAETQLSLKLASTRSRTLKTYADLYMSAKARELAFDNNTRLKESSTTTNDRQGRNRSRSRRSKSKRRNPSSSRAVNDRSTQHGDHYPTHNSADNRPSTTSDDNPSNNNDVAQQAMNFFTQMFRSIQHNPTNRSPNRGRGSSRSRGNSRGRSHYSHCQ